MADMEPTSVDQARRLVTMKEAAKMLGISRSHLYRLCKAGKIRTVRLGRAVRIAASELDRVAASV